MSTDEIEPAAIVPGSTSEPLSDIDSDDSDDVALTRGEGAPSKETSLRNGRDQMMFIVLLSVLLITVAAVFSLSLAQFLVIHDSQSLAQEVLSACMIVGIIVIVLLYVKNDVVAETPQKKIRRRRSVRDRLRYILRHFLSIVGMSFFYPFSCILDLFHVVTTTSCGSVWRQCGGQDYEHHIAIVFFHLLRILFMGAELLFCLRFHSARFMRNASVPCGLMIIMAVNLGLWFITLLHETADRDTDPTDAANVSRTELPSGCRNATDLDHVLKCLDRTTPEYRRLEHVKPYLFPFAIEFSILVGEFLAEKFCRCRKQTEETTPKREAPTANSQSIICADTSSEVSVDEDRRSRPFRWTFVLVVAIGIFVNVISLTLAFYTTPVGDSHSETSVVKGRGVFQNYMIFYWALASVLIGVGFGCGGSTRVQQKKMRGIDYLVLTSAFGPLIEGSIGIIVIIRNSAEIGKRINWMVFLASELTNLVQFILQVPFLFYSDRVRFSELERGSLLEGTFKAVVLSMAICNITQWILNSLLLANTSIRSRLLKTCFHGQPNTWYFLDGMLGPLAIFFRFSSFLLFLRAYLGG